MAVFKFEELEKAPLIIDAIYKGNNKYKDIRDEPLHELLPKTSNQGGIRITHRKDNMKLPAYVVIYTSLEEPEWPDSLDVETGILRYYGDNKKPGDELHSTRKKGNELFKDVFSWLNNDAKLSDIPPFLVFCKTGVSRDVRFMGLAVPGNSSITPNNELVAVWKTLNNKRFQNYEAYFTILDTGEDVVSKEWLKMLVENHSDSIKLAPEVWKKFIKNGRQGIVPLTSEVIDVIPKQLEQLPTSEEGKSIINKIKEYYKDNPYGFENCSKHIVQMLDDHFTDIELTRPWRDGGRDAIGKYKIGPTGRKLGIVFALEAKCYAIDKKVGVKEMSRLISRIKYREFGILVTTSFVGKQAYQEVVEDGHPILMITGKDIADLLMQNDITSNNVVDWLRTIEQ